MLNTVQYADITRYAVLPEQSEVYTAAYGHNPAKEFDYVIRYAYRDIDVAEIAHRHTSDYYLVLQGDTYEASALFILEEILIDWILEAY